MRLTILGQVPSLKNSKQIFVNRTTGRPFITSSQASKQWVTDALWQLKTARPVQDYPISLTMTFYFKGKHRKDLDNAASSVLDVLRDSGVIEDDDWRYVTELHLHYGGQDKQNPRVEIDVTTL